MNNKTRILIIYGSIFIVILSVFLFSCHLLIKHYLIYHTFVELAGVTVSMTIFCIGWNTRKYAKNNFMTILAIGYLVIGILTVFHILSYKGMSVIILNSANMSTQFWISSRYMEGVTLLAAGISLRMKKEVNAHLLLGVYLLLGFIIVGSIITGVFPVCFIDGYGLTKFKIYSEYLICIILFIDGYMLWRNRRQLDSDNLILILNSIIVMILTELTFTLYNDVNGILNILGHLFMVLSLVLMYNALIKNNLSKPYKSLFKSISDYAEEIAAKNFELDIKDKAIESSLNAIVLIDNNGKIKYVNESFCRIMGYDKNEVLGYPPSVFLYSSDELSAMRDQFIKEGRWYGELLLKKKDKTCINSLLTANIIRLNENESICGMASFLDITERKNMVKELMNAKNEAEAANIAKSYFLANMSHEIRTPMNGMLGFLQLLETTPTTGRQREYIEKVKTSTDTLLRILNNILDVSKIEAGKMEFEIASFDLWTVIENSAMTYAAEADEKGLKLYILINPDVPRYVIGDSMRLRQVIINLVSNAIKFTKDGYVLVKAELIGRDKTFAKISFCIEDTGIGFGEEIHKRLFKPFAQGEASSSRKFGGTGLGLSICKSIVTLMGGTIRVDSTEGKGSKFIFDVPLEEVRSHQFGIDDKKEEQIERTVSLKSEKYAIDRVFTRENIDTYDISQLKVLLAEDNEINRFFIIELLKTLQIKCDIAINGEEAVKACLSNDYDLVFMDCQMPIIDGYEATKRIRFAQGDMKHTIIIALTAIAMKGDAEKCLESGMDAYISKPVDINDVTEIIKKYAKQPFLV